MRYTRPKASEQHGAHTMTARSTKQACRNAFMNLIHEHPYGSITVGDIAREAGISRKSFYNYFDNKYGLVNWILYAEMTKIRKAPLDQGLDVAFKSFLDFFATDRPFFSAALSDDSPEGLGQYYTDLLYEIARPTLSRILRTTLNGEDEVERALSLLVQTARNLTVTWLNDPHASSSDDLVDFSHRILKALAATTSAEHASLGEPTTHTPMQNLSRETRNPAPQAVAIRIPKPDSALRLAARRGTAH